MTIHVLSQPSALKALFFKCRHIALTVQWAMVNAMSLSFGSECEGILLCQGHQNLASLLDPIINEFLYLIFSQSTY